MKYGHGGGVFEGVWKEGHDLCCMLRSLMPASLFQFILVCVSLCLCTLASWNKKANKPADICWVCTYGHAIILRLATRVVILSHPFLYVQISEYSCFGHEEAFRTSSVQKTPALKLKATHTLS